MCTEAMSQNSNMGQFLSNLPVQNFEVSENLQNYAQELLNYGEYLSYAKYAKYVPGAPAALTNKNVSLMGDSCKLVNAGLKIQSRVASILSDNTSPDIKAKQLLEVGQIALKLVDTQFVEYLPDSASACLKKMSTAFGAIDMGVNSKMQLEGLGYSKNSGLASAMEKIDASRSVFQTANAALNVAGVGMFSPVKVGVCLGAGLLTAAKVGVSAVSAGVTAGQYIGKAVEKALA
ncbi:MAG: hypothetical protein H0V82_06335 [Candidatus Protochlamydia sp.]|nr:hypothetical protein [Candidatus Protochlamydia sp.]